MSKQKRRLATPTDSNDASTLAPVAAGSSGNHGPASDGAARADLGRTPPIPAFPAGSEERQHGDPPVVQSNGASPPEPAESVSPRAGAMADPAMLHVAWDSAVKQNLFASRSGYPGGAINLQTRLQVTAWVKPTTQKRSVWIDVHVLSYDGVLVHVETFPLWHRQQADDGGDLFAIDRMLYDGSIATRGSVTPMPDARTVQYRLYCQLGAQIFTDAILHQCDLRADAASG